MQCQGERGIIEIEFAQHRARSCSTRTSRSSPSSAGWASSTSATDGAREARSRREAGAPAGASGRSCRSCCSSRGRRSSRRPAARSPTWSATTRRRSTSSTSAASSSQPGEIRIQVTNPQRDDLTIATVTVDDAIVPYALDGPADARPPALEHDRRPVRLGRRTSRSRSASRARRGSRRRRRSPPRSRRRRRRGRSSSATALIGLLVGVVPVALGLLWLPSLRRARPQWLAAFMALTAGLLTFLGVEALSEALDLQAALPSALGGAGLVLLGVAASYLTLTLLSHRLARRNGWRSRAARRPRARDARRDRHRPAQPRRGPRDRLVVRARRARARDVPHRRLHGPQRHRGPRHRGADRRKAARTSRSAGSRRSP